jgi:hypothetical protein
MFAVPIGDARSKVETKADNGRPTKTQLETITAMEATGAFCWADRARNPEPKAERDEDAVEAL